MTKKDLKTGMIAEHADGRRSIVFIGTCCDEDGMAFNNGGWTKLKTYNDDLTWRDNRTDHEKSVAIVKLYKPNTIASCLGQGYEDNYPNGLTLIWEREEPPVEMTLEEVCKALGKDIKIVK